MEGQRYALICTIFYLGIEHPQDFGICRVPETNPPVDTERQLSFCEESKVIHGFSTGQHP